MYGAFGKNNNQKMPGKINNHHLRRLCRKRIAAQMLKKKGIHARNRFQIKLLYINERLKKTRPANNTPARIEDNRIG
jgi:hypothetical protein